MLNESVHVVPFIVPTKYLESNQQYDLFTDVELLGVVFHLDNAEPAKRRPLCLGKCLISV
jgi:hypothetical protein